MTPEIKEEEDQEETFRDEWKGLEEAFAIQEAVLSGHSALYAKKLLEKYGFSVPENIIKMIEEASNTLSKYGIKVEDI